MNSVRNTSIPITRIEKALGGTRVPLTDTPCPDLESVALTLSGHANAAEIGIANRHLEQCGACREALLVLSDLTAKGVVPPLVVPPTAHATGRNRWTISFSTQKALLAAAAMIALAVGAYFAWPEKSTLPDADLVVKGTGDELFVGIRRDAAEFLVRPGQKLVEGDQVGLFYSTEASGYLAIYNLDDTGAATLIYPAGQTRSARISAKRRAPLPDGAEVGKGSGCEWFIAIFSDSEFDLETTAQTLEQAKLSSPPCALKVDLPVARSVRIVPLTR